MSSLYVRDTIKNYVKQIIINQGWPVDYIEIDNERAKAPASGNDWIVVEFIGSDENQITTGAPKNNTYRETGEFLIHYVTKSASGAINVYDRLEYYRDQMRSEKINGIIINNVNPPDSNPAAGFELAKGNWWSSSILISYEYDIRG